MTLAGGFILFVPLLHFYADLVHHMVVWDSSMALDSDATVVSKVDAGATHVKLGLIIRVHQ